MVSNEKLKEMLGIKDDVKIVNPNKIESMNVDDSVFANFKSNNLQNNSNVEEAIFLKFRQNNNTTNEQKNVSQNNTPDINNIKISANDLDGIGKKLEGIPPLLLVGIICIIAAGFTPYKFLFGAGFILIILALFSKVIPKEKKEDFKNKIKAFVSKLKGKIKKKEDVNANK